uniref:Exostosin GT47 domain-containing protein n=1 Tax=viral metagenome TaxID=1070528 RepID=A0A6C0CPW7_9ZZZZ
MLLQEYLVRESLKEKKIVGSIKIDHSTGETTINNTVRYPIIFPISRINAIRSIGNNIKKEIDYAFKGLITDAKLWVNAFKNVDNCKIIESTNGRNPRIKYSVDKTYYSLLCKSKFVLCPTDVYPWSYRFFEAIICNAIPILDDNEYDRYSHEFKFYRKSEKHIYREDYVEYNYKKLLLYHTLKTSWRTFPMWQPFIEKYCSYNNFKKLVSNKYIHNYNKVHKDAFIATLKSNKKYWHSLIGIDNNNRILNRINHFIDTYSGATAGQHPFHQSNYKLYSRILQCYHYLTTNKNNKDLVINISDEACLISNPFTGVNSGHDLSIIFNCVEYCNVNNINNIILHESAKWYPNNLNILKHILNKKNIIWIEDGFIYRFSHLHTITNLHMKIEKHDHLIKDVIKRNNLLDIDVPRKLLYRKILLLKCDRNKQAIRKDTALRCEKLIKELTSNNNYIFINPEDYHIDILIRILLSAKTIVSSWGGILYTNSIFFNPESDCKKIFICVGNQRPTKEWSFITKESYIINIKNNNLDSNKVTHNKIKNFIYERE